MKEIRQVNSIQPIYDFYMQYPSKILLVLDIDEVVLSTRNNFQIVDTLMIELVKKAYQKNPINVFFLTSRCSSIHMLTMIQLQKALKLKVYTPQGIKRDLFYQILYSPPRNGMSTKGEKLLEYLRIRKYPRMLILFVDDIVENIDSVKKHLDETLETANHDYCLFNFISPPSTPNTHLSFTRASLSALPPVPPLFFPTKENVPVSTPYSYYNLFMYGTPPPPPPPNHS